MDKAQLSISDYRLAARMLGLKELAPLRAVLHVEASGRFFYRNGQTPILFEAHIFDELTGGRFRQSHPNLSRRRWTPGLYKGGLAEYQRLEAACRLDRRAALMSASWGAAQILGRNFRMCGFEDVEQFVAAMQRSAREQLLAFVRFVKSARLDDELRAHAWRPFAKGYNGPSYAKHDYHGRLARAYERFARTPELIPAPVADDDLAQQLMDSRWYVEPAVTVAAVAGAPPSVHPPARPAATPAIKRGIGVALASLLAWLAHLVEAVNWPLVIGLSLLGFVLAALVWERWQRRPAWLMGRA